MPSNVRGGLGAANAVADSINAVLDAAGKSLTARRLHGALTAGSYWLDTESKETFAEEKSLIGGRKLLELCQWLRSVAATSLYTRRTSRRSQPAISAYQRRRNGYDSPTRSPKIIVDRLPPAAQEIIDQYADQLIYHSPNAAHAFAATLAVALGRPVDETVTFQLEIALGTSIIWTEMNGASQRRRQPSPAWKASRA